VVSFASQKPNVHNLFPASSHKISHCSPTKVFISEITARAFIIADSNKRRTLSRADIAKALAKSDQFDFLIDIVPREEGLTGLTQSGAGTGAVAGGSGSGMTNLVAGVRVTNTACRTSQ
jgi:nuclear transcription factor Y gamma